MSQARDWKNQFHESENWFFGLSLTFLQVHSLEAAQSKNESVVKSAVVRFPLAWFVFRAFSQTLPHLAIFAVMLLTFASGEASSWQCQGRDCGTTAWTCCCAQPTDRKNSECNEARSHFQRAEHAAEVSVCQVDCHCTKVVQGEKPSVASSHFAFTPPASFVVSRPFASAFATPVLSETPQFHPSRGPPSRAVCLATPSLRGPPSPDVFRTFEPKASARL